MMPLWTSAEIAAATGGRAHGAFGVAGIAIDSRQVAKGDLFVALTGPHFDGHDFVAAALAEGAAGLLAAHDVSGPAVIVGDTLIGLMNLGRAARARSLARITAITGSVGKTSTKEMLRLALSEFGKTHASAGNLNNHWGAPLSLARMARDCAFGIFELGMNHAGEIAPLSQLVRPDIAIITNVAPAHLEFFDSLNHKFVR